MVLIQFRVFEKDWMEILWRVLVVKIGINVCESYSRNITEMMHRNTDYIMYQYVATYAGECHTESQPKEHIMVNILNS